MREGRRYRIQLPEGGATFAAILAVVLSGTFLFYQHEPIGQQPTAEAQTIQQLMPVSTLTMGQASRPVRYIGDETITDLSSADALTPTAGATYAEIVPYDGNVRLRAGGNNPTATAGRIIYEGDSYIVPEPGATYKLFAAETGAKAFVVYWGP